MRRLAVGPGPGQRTLTTTLVAWLREDANCDVGPLLQPNPSEAMRAYRVGTTVNSVKNSGPECIEPMV